MDVTPQLIEQIDFAEKFRGYDPDQVDDFLERVGATIAELDKSLREANERADRAEAELATRGAAPTVAAAPVATMTDEEEAMQSTRTLMMAKRTADAAIADARQEAQKLVEDARTSVQQQQAQAQTEADRIVGEARVKADQMTQKATADANREYGTRRDQILAEIGDLEKRKSGVHEHLSAIEGRLGEYRSGLTTIHGAIASVLDDPSTALREPLAGLEPPAATTAAPVVEATAAPATAAPTIDQPAVDASFADSSFGDSSLTGSSIEQGPLTDSSFDDPATSPGHDVLDHDAFAAAPDPWSQAPAEHIAPVNSSTDVLATGVDTESAFAEAGFAEVGFSEPGLGDGGFSQPVMTEPTFGETAYAAEASVVADGAFSDAEVGAADPWGPGSWNEVAAGDATGSIPAFAETAAVAEVQSFDAPAAFAPGDAFAAPDGQFAAGGQAFSDFPSDGLPVIGQDRYTRDLDQAVNQAGDAPDDAMAAFFEGDDAEQPQRRFGRRR